MTYRVVIRFGDAVGYTYETAVEPDEVIHIAPAIINGWMRVPADTDPPWPGQKRYKRALPEAMDGDVAIIPYDMEPDARIAPWPNPRRRLGT